jgi:outer membrane protein
MTTSWSIRIRELFAVGVLLTGMMLDPFAVRSVWAEDKWTFGFRVGPAFYTQDVIEDTSSSVGPAINFQALYGIAKYISVGLAIEWERHSVESEAPSVDLGTVNTVSVLPTIEIRPGRYGKFMPYGTLAFGVNVNSFSEDDALAGANLDMDNTFAFRIGAGTDYFLTPKLALNTELAWKRNAGDVTVAGGQTDFNASSILFLFGVRYHM